MPGKSLHKGDKSTYKQKIICRQKNLLNQKLLSLQLVNFLAIFLANAEKPELFQDIIK